MCWRSQQLRENVLTDYASMYPTAFQRIMTIINYKAKREAIVGRLSAKALADSWRENVEMSSTAEQLSDTVIDNAITVWNRLLVQTPVRAVLMQADEELGHHSPFNSINKLHIIVFKGRSTENIAWIVFSIWDHIKSGIRSPSDFGTRALQGAANQKGFCEFFLRKKSTLEHINHTLLPELGVPIRVREFVKEHLQTHASYRAIVPHAMPGKPHDVDLSFLSTWKESDRKVFDMIESLVFLVVYDSTLMQCMRDRKGAPDVFDMCPLKEVLDTIKELKAAEADENAKATEHIAKTVEADFSEEELEVACPVRTTDHGDMKPYTSAEKAQISTFQKEAARAIRQSIKLVAEPSREQALVELIRDSAAGQMRGDVDGQNRSYVAFVLEARLVGESVTRPAIRAPTLQPEHARKLVRAALLSRVKADEEQQTLDEDSFHDGDQFVFLDGGKHGGPSDRHGLFFEIAIVLCHFSCWLCSVVSVRFAC